MPSSEYRVPGPNPRPAPSAQRPALSKCRHFGTCGGCAHQDVGYAEQMESKRIRFKELLSSFGIEPSGFEPAPSPWYYRNKIELTFGESGDGGVILGFKEKGKWYRTIDLKECLIFDKRLPKLVRAVISWAEEEKLSVYRSRPHAGFLRYLVLRRSIDSGALMAIIVTTSERDFPRETLLRALNPFTAQALWGIHDERADTALPQRVEIISGPDYLEERLLGRVFRYSAESFFQTNPQAFEILLRDLVAEAANRSLTLVLPHQGGGKALDLYCGVGTIALTLEEELGAAVTGVESVSSAIADARFNGAAPLTHPSREEGWGEGKGVNGAQGSGQPQFIQAKAEDIVEDILKKPEFHEGLVIVDPPRSGLHPRVIKAITENPPAHLFYVCCNPELACRQELPRISQIYKIVLVKAYDFFPHTDHYEAFLVFERRN